MFVRGCERGMAMLFEVPPHGPDDVSARHRFRGPHYRRGVIAMLFEALPDGPPAMSVSTAGPESRLHPPGRIAFGCRMFSEGSVMTGKVVLIEASTATKPLRGAACPPAVGGGAATSTAPRPSGLKSCGGRANAGASEALFRRKGHVAGDEREHGIGRNGPRYRRHYDRT